MKIIKYVFVLLLFSVSITAQEDKKVPIKERSEEEETDTLWGQPIQLEEVVIYKGPIDEESRKQFQLLQNRVHKVYPYAKVASERLTLLERNMAKLKTDRERRKYFKIVENYIEDEFTERLKKLSRKQGQILVKLIYRQTGSTTFDLVKEHKSGWKAFWASNTAKVFDINLKSKYDPFTVNEDYLIETILERAFQNGRLIKQDPARPIDYERLTLHWLDKASMAKGK
jgi:hypothetical protein